MNATSPRPCVYEISRLPVFAGRRNGRWPTSAVKPPIGMPGNKGLTCGVTELLRDVVTTASRYVYEPATRTRPNIASADISTPFALNDWEFTYAPVPAAAATSGAIPNCG